jgi:integrase
MGRPRKAKLPEGIYARGPVYWVTYVDAAGKRHRESGGRTVEAAVRFRRDRLEAVRNGTLGREKANAETPLGAYADGVLAKRAATVRTIGRERQLFDTFVRPHLGDVPLASIRPRTVIAWIEKIRGTRAPKTVRNAHAVLSAVLAVARVDELVADNAAKGLPPKTLPKVDRRTKSSWTRAEVGAFISSPLVPDDRRVVYAIAAFTGARLGEIAGMRWADLDTAARPLWRWSLRTQYDGAPLKTDNPRDVPIHPELQRILERWRADGWPHYTAGARYERGFVVPREDGAVHSDNSMGAKAVTRHAAKLGIEVGTRDFHSFRRFFITHAREDGASAEAVERITHNATGTMIDGYTYFGWPFLCSAVERLVLSHSISHSGGET